MDSNMLKALLDKYFDGDSSLKEERQLKEYFSSEKNIPNEFQYARELFVHLHDQNNPEKSKRILTRKPLLWLSTIAACAAIMVVLYIRKQQTPAFITHNNPTQEVQFIQLNKYIKLWMNSNAHVSYLRKNTKVGVVSITGQVYVEVSSSKECTFEVNNTHVIGATQSAFEIKDLPDQLSTEIIVTRGSIRVSGKDQDHSLTLLVDSGSYCSIHKTQQLAYVTTTRNKNHLAWKTKEFNFTNEPLKTVTDVLAEYYQVRFEIMNRELAYCQFSGSFQGQSLQEILASIQSATGTTVHQRGSIIALSDGNCMNN